MTCSFLSPNLFPFHFPSLWAPALSAQGHHGHTDGARVLRLFPQTTKLQSDLQSTSGAAGWASLPGADTDRGLCDSQGAPEVLEVASEIQQPHHARSFF